MSTPTSEPAVANLGIRFGFAAAIVAAFTALLSFAAAHPQAMIEPAVGPVPLSLCIAFAMIVFAVGLTGLYVLLANRSAL